MADEMVAQSYPKWEHRDSANDIIDQLSWFITNEVRMPAGLIVTVINKIERLHVAGDALYESLAEFNDPEDGLRLIAWEDARRD